MAWRARRGLGRPAAACALALVGWSAAGGAAGAPATLRAALPFADGMVIQRDVPVPVRGVAAPGAEVTVTLDGRTASGRADAAGRWRVELPPSPAGGPHELAIESGGERAVLRDVLVGDVWLCSGQSNMEWTVADSMDAAAEIAAARDPGVRHFKVPRSWAAEPAAEIAGGAWEPAGPAHAGGFTAAGWFFARDLRPHAGAPIGLINVTWGGSRIEPWMSAASLGLGAGESAALLERERGYEREVLGRLRARLDELPERDAGLAGGCAVWADPGLDEAGWQEIAVPARWEEEGWEGMDGVAWYRTAFDLTAEEVRAAATGARIGLGRIDDSDVAWVNGHEVGRSERAWNRARVYPVPPGALAAGRNVVAVRVEDTGGGGGVWGDPAELYLEIGGGTENAAGVGRLPLAGSWRFRPAAVRVDLDEHKNQVPTMLYNRMIHPLEDFPVRGVLWYQGESNAGPGDALAYRDLFRALIEDWRRARGEPALPFLFVQLAAFMAPAEEPGESDWALLRESQSAALALPATAQVVLLDAGDAGDVHPRDKQVVGRRLALAARRVAYGEELVHSGPVYRGHEIAGGRVLIEFDHAGGGLVTGSAERGRPGEPGAPGGFAIAGADRRFVRARARIERTPEGERVAVWSEEVPEPAAVRYGWADNPVLADLYNREGLPAAPFRTDSW